MSAPEPTIQPQENTYFVDAGTVELPSVTLETLRKELCRRWDADDPIPAEILFPPDADRALKLGLVITEMVLREETGRRATMDDYRARLPDLADDIERQMNLLGVMPDDDEGSTIVVRRRSGLAPGAVNVPGYEIERQLGRGGMGVVYLARQVRFDRPVALKVMVAGTQASAEDVRRFRTEAEAIARINHPGIVQVFDTGEWTPPGGAPLPYFSMEYCPGGSLGAKLKGDPQPPAVAARIGRDLARAAHAAHAKGIVHRDIKPGNVLLLDEAVKITDFGLAKKLDAEEGDTRSGSIMGTPSYMPPEQAAGKAHQSGPLADVYALGAVLYEMLVGRPPFKGATLLETLHEVQHCEPVAPRRLRPTVPRDLETITLKCLRKDPRKRYASAAALADDLQRFLDGRPIKARPVWTVERGWRWANRNPALAGSFAVSTVAAVALIALAFWVSARLWAADAEKVANNARISLAEVQWKAAEDVARAQRFFALLTRVRERSVRRRTGWTWASLADLREAAGLADGPDRLAELRTEAATCLASIDARPAVELLPDALLTSVAWHPNDKLLALGERAFLLWPWCNIYLVAPSNPSSVQTLTVPAYRVTNSAGTTAPDVVRSLVFAPDGRRVAAGMRSGWLHVFDLCQPKPKRESVQLGTCDVSSVAFAADGRTLFAVSDKGMTALDPATLAPLAELKGRRSSAPVVPDPAGGGVVSSPEGTRWLDERLRDHRPAGGEGRVHRWLADGRLMVVDGGRARVVDREGKLGFYLIAPGSVSAHESGTRAYAPDRGHVLLTTSGDDRHARLWDPCDGRLMAHLVVGSGTCHAAISPTGRGFVVLEEKGARLFEIRERREARPIAMQAGEINTFALHEGGQTLATMAASGDNMADYALHAVAGRAAPRSFRVAHNDPTSRAFHMLLNGPANTLIRAGAFVDRSQLIGSEVLDGSGAFSVPVAGRTLHGLARGSGRYWAVADEALTGWGRGGEPGPEWRHALGEVLTGKASLYAVAAAGDRVAVGCRDGRLRAFDDAGKKLRLVHSILAGEAALTSVALSADGCLALAGSDRGEVILFDLVTGTIVARHQGHEDDVTGVAFLPDGLLVSGSADQFIRLWRADAEGFHEVVGLRHDGPVRRLEVSPDGVTLYALLAREHGVRSWHLGRLFGRFGELGLGGGLPPLQARPLEAPSAAPALPETPSGPGLRCELYRLPGFLAPVRARVDQAIDHDASKGPLDPGMLTFPYSARWTGWLKVPATGRYTIRLSGSPGLRLWLDGERRIDLEPGAAPREFTIEAALEAGPHELRVEANVTGGGSAPKLTWSRADGFTEQVIGPGALFTDRESAAKAK